MSVERHDPWLEIHDTELTSEELAARVEERLQQRRITLGPVSRHFPTFQGPAADLDAAAMNLEETLRDTMRQLRQLPAPATHANLAPSPATRLPLFGRLWQLVRSQAHELVLFYVNRHMAHQAQQNHLVSGALQRLAALLLAQQQEIELLQTRIEQLEAAAEEPDE